MNELYLKPVLTVEERDELVKKANEDKHLVLNPSHVMLRGKEPVGYFAIGTTPLTYCWFSNMANLTTAQVAEFLTRAEHTFQDRVGLGHTIIPCPKDSPFHGLLTPERGFINVGTYDLFVKEIK